MITTSSRPLLRRATRRLALAALLVPGVCHAATLFWGPTGNGGSGGWQDNFLNWYDGSQTVIWASGDDAVFQGTSGTFSSVNQTAASLTFTTAGYVLNGSLFIPTNGMTISTPMNTTIGASFTPFQNNSPTVTKTGQGMLTLTSPIAAAIVNIAQGNLQLGASPGAAGMTFSLANTAGAKLTLDSGVATTFRLSLSGGGTTGGIVQPTSVPGTTTVLLSAPGSNSFDGVLQDNASGTLAVQVSTPSQPQIFTNANTYSGPTLISAGTLTLSGVNGAVSNSAITVAANGTLTLDNSGSPNASRLDNAVPLTLQGGTLSVLGAKTSTLTVNIGGVVLSNGGAQLTLVQNGSPPTRPATQITINSVTRNGHATLNLTGTHTILSSVPIDTSGIAPAWVTFDSEWAAASPTDGSIVMFNNYVTTQAASAATKNLKLATGTLALTANTTANSLNLEGSGTNPMPVLDLGTHSLTLVGGGILSVSTVNAAIQNGTLSTTGSEYVITNSNSLGISANIGQTNAGTVLTKSGAGTLTLSGTNTYTGVTSIQKGTLIVTADANLGQGTSVEFGGGVLQAGASFSSTKNITSVGAATALINTNGFNVALSGSISGSLVKSGAGNLTISSAPSGTAEVDAGALSIFNATGGTFNLAGGTLSASGRLTQVTAQAGTTLDPGGAAAGTLRIDTLLPSVPLSFGAPLTIDFGLGTAGDDQLMITNTLSSSFSFAALQFEFQDLGGLTTGVDYSLGTFGGTLPSTAIFGLAPDLTADGWVANFQFTGNSLSVNFSAIPEPSSAGLLTMAAGMLALRRRRGGRGGRAS